MQKWPCRRTRWSFCLPRQRTLAMRRYATKCMLCVCLGALRASVARRAALLAAERAPCARRHRARAHAAPAARVARLARRRVPRRLVLARRARDAHAQPVAVREQAGRAPDWLLRPRKTEAAFGARDARRLSRRWLVRARIATRAAAGARRRKAACAARLVCYRTYTTCRARWALCAGRRRLPARKRVVRALLARGRDRASLRACDRTQALTERRQHGQWMRRFGRLRLTVRAARAKRQRLGRGRLCTHSSWRADVLADRGSLVLWFGRPVHAGGASSREIAVDWEERQPVEWLAEEGLVSASGVVPIARLLKLCRRDAVLTHQPAVQKATCQKAGFGSRLPPRPGHAP